MKNDVKIRAALAPSKDSGVILNGVQLKDVVSFSVEAQVDQPTKVTITLLADVNVLTPPTSSPPIIPSQRHRL